MTEHSSKTEEELIAFLKERLLSDDGPASDSSREELEDSEWGPDNVIQIDGTIEIEQLAGEILHYIANRWHDIVPPKAVPRTGE